MVENSCALCSVTHRYDWFRVRLGMFHLAAYHFEKLVVEAVPSNWIGVGGQLAWATQC